MTDPFEILGWKIQTSSGGGFMGTCSITAVASKGGLTISAAADNEESALGTLQDMIRKREAHLVA